MVVGRFSFIGLSAQFTWMSSDIILKSRNEDILTVSTQKFYLYSPKALTLQLPCYNGAPLKKKTKKTMSKYEDKITTTTKKINKAMSVQGTCLCQVD